MEHFNEGKKTNSIAKTEKCTNLLSETNKFKNTLCSIGKSLNQNKIFQINAYSNVNDVTLLLTEDQGTFRQIESKTYSILNEKTPYEYWGVKSWITNSNAYHFCNKYFAFGEAPTDSKNMFADVRFVDVNGNILKSKGINSINVNEYIVEKSLDKSYINSIYGAFVVNGSNNKYLIFLKKNSTYDILSVYNYSILKSGHLSDIFQNIDLKDLKNIDYIIKFKNDIALFKKNEFTKKYEFLSE